VGSVLPISFSIDPERFEVTKTALGQYGHADNEFDRGEVLSTV